METVETIIKCILLIAIAAMAGWHEHKYPSRWLKHWQALNKHNLAKWGPGRQKSDRTTYQRRLEASRNRLKQGR